MPVPPPSPPRTLFGYLLRQHRMTYEGFAQYAEAYAREHGIDATLSARHAQRLAVGRREGRAIGWVHPGTQKLLEAIFDRPVHELLSPAPEGSTVVAKRVILTGQNREGQPEEVGPTDRRSFMGVAGAASVAAGVSIPDHDLLRIATDTGSVTPDHLEWIEHETEEIACQVLNISDVATLRDPALRMYRSVCALLSVRQRTADQVRLTRAAAVLAGSLGEISFSLGERDQAQAFLETARSAALDVGDPYVADIALASLGFVSLYGGKPNGALGVAAYRLSSPPARPNAGTARLMGMVARAHAGLGDRSACHRFLDQARDALDRAPKPEVQVWDPFEHRHLEFYNANASSRLGDATRAIDAADRALELFDPTDNQDRALIQFDKATALYHADEVDQACRVALGAVHDPNMFFGTAVQRRAAEFDTTLGWTRTTAATDWRDAYHTIKRQSTQPATFA